MVERYELAEQDYMAGMKYKDIAEKYKTTINTVKSWKKRYAWNRKEGAPKKEKVCTQNKKVQSVKSVRTDDGTKETLQNDDLSTEYQMFCIQYVRTFNATQSYLKVFNCSYNTANAEGYKLLVKPCVKKEIQRLKELKRQQIIAGEEDIVELQMRTAFSDIGNVLSFGIYEVETKSGALVEVSQVNLNESCTVDTQLIESVKEGRGGVSVKMRDPQKAIDWLTKYFLMHPDDKYKAAFDKKRAEVKDDSAQKLLENMQSIAEVLQHPVDNRKIEELEGGDADE